MEPIQKKIDIVTTAEYIDDACYFFYTTFIRQKQHGETFRFWLNDAELTPEEQLEPIRFKADNGDDTSKVIFCIPREERPVFVDLEHTEPDALLHFPCLEEALLFLEEFRLPLTWQWYGKIDSNRCVDIIKLVRKKKRSLSEAIHAVLFEMTYESLYDALCGIDAISPKLHKQLQRICHCQDISQLPVDAAIVQHAQHFLQTTPPSYEEHNEWKEYRELIQYLLANIEQFRRLLPQGGTP